MTDFHDYYEDTDDDRPTLTQESDPTRATYQVQFTVTIDTTGDTGEDADFIEWFLAGDDFPGWQVHVDTLRVEEHA